MQFGYEHRGFDNAFNQVRKSAEEVSKMLNKMSKKEEKKANKMKCKIHQKQSLYG